MPDMDDLRKLTRDHLRPGELEEREREREDAGTLPRPDELDTAPRDSVAGRPDQGPVHMTGPGAGGATQSGGRLVHHEGMNPPQNQPNS